MISSRAHLLAQSLNLAFQSAGFGLELRQLRPVSFIEGHQVAMNVFLDLLPALVDLAGGEILVARVFSALSLLPSMATNTWMKSFKSRDTTTNRRYTLRISVPLSRLKSAIVLKSGARRPANQIRSTLR